MFVFFKKNDLCFGALYFISNNECPHLVLVLNISCVGEKKWGRIEKQMQLICETCTQREQLITANYSLDTCNNASGVIDCFKEVDVASGSPKLMCKVP